VPTSVINNILEGAACAAGLCSQRGWAERNAGNLSINITGDIIRRMPDLSAPVVRLSRRYQLLAGQILLVSRTGSRMRDIAVRPGTGTGLLQISSDGRSYMSSDPAFRPTTELPTHLAIHEHLLRSGSADRAVLHTHPDECIALTHMIDCRNSGKINRILSSMIPETVIVNPRGVGCLPFAMPGSEGMAAGTVRLLKKSPVVLWEKHGVLAVGENIIEAFDLIDTVNKAAKLYLMCCNAGMRPRGLAPGQVQAIRRHFHPSIKSSGR
jgi:rhamnulose-1-phosphate aldolase